jgi:hypothetical protein
VCEVGPRVDIDLVEHKGVVVFSPLEHLCDVALDAPRSIVVFDWKKTSWGRTWVGCGMLSVA